MSYVQLDRRFRELRGDTNEMPRFGEPPSSIQGPLSWEALLRKRRVAILAEGGSGKSRELEEQHKRMLTDGKHSFHASVLACASGSFSNAIGVEATAALEAWLQSDEPGWFFLDSVDEAKALGRRLSEALRSIADAISKAEARAHIVLSGRPSEWEARRDLRLLTEMLPLPVEEQPQPDPDSYLLEAIHMRRAKAPEQPEDLLTPVVVEMSALDSTRIGRYAAARGVADVTAFTAALSRAGLVSIARRPLDLQWLIEYWQSKGRFASLKVMVALSVKKRLVETSPSRAETDTLEDSRAQSALELVAAAMTLRRIDSVRVPDEDLDVPNPPPALNLDEELLNFSGSERKRLLRRAVFDPAASGLLRLHNDNYGLVRSFLTARWLVGLRDNNCPRDRLERLIFSHDYGIRTVKPSMRQAAAWMATEDRDVARAIAEHDPRILVECGDAGSLDLQTRVATLTAITKEARDDQTFSPYNFDALRRFSQPDLAPSVRALWTIHSDSASAQKLLLQLIWHGRIRECLDLALPRCYELSAEPAIQVFAARSLCSMGTQEQRRDYASHLRDAAPSLDPMVFWNGARELFPSEFSPADLAAALEDPRLHVNQGGHGITYDGRELIGRINDPDQAATLLSALIKHVETSTPEGYGDPLLEAMEACAARLLDIESSKRHVKAASEALLASRVKRAKASLEHEDDDALSTKMSSSPARRRALYWMAFRKLKDEVVFHGVSLTEPFQLQMIGALPALELTDVGWLVADALDKPKRAEFALAGGQWLWDMNGRPKDLAPRFKALRKLSAAAKARHDAWLAHPRRSKIDPEVRRLSKEAKKRNEKATAERNRNLLESANKLRANPSLVWPRPPLVPTVITGYTRYLWDMLQRTPGSSTRHSVSDTSPLARAFSPEVEQEFRKLALNMWRQHDPVPAPLRGPNESLKYAEALGLIGIAIESEDPAWASRLATEDAEIASRYATLELNGFPQWLNALCLAHPAAVAKTFCECIDAQWFPGPVAASGDFLRRIAATSRPVRHVCAPRVMAKLLAGHVGSDQLLEHALAVVKTGTDSPSRVADFALGQFKTARALTQKALYLACGFANDAERAGSELEKALARAPRPKAKVLAEVAMPMIFGGAWMRHEEPLDLSLTPTSCLERLVVAAYGSIRPTEDIEHPNGQVYSPGQRDNAEDARDASLRMLAGRPGLATVESLKRLIALRDFPVPQRYLRMLLAERAATDGESEPWSAGEAREFERDFTSAPRSAKDLRDVLLGRLDDIRHEVNDGRYNRGVELARLASEREVQNWFANELHKRQGRSYSCAREAHVANEKEPDILAEAKSSDASVPIEIKVAESWSTKQLERAVEVQLAGQYLRERDHRWGILLVVCKEHRANGWAKPGGGNISVAELAAHLQRVADKLAASGQFAPEVSITLVDVSARAASLGKRQPPTKRSSLSRRCQT